MSIPEQIQQLRNHVNGYKLSMLLMAAERLGVFAQLGSSSKSTDELTSVIDVPAQRLSSILNALVGMGFLDKTSEKYSIAEAFAVLNPAHPASQVGYIRYAEEVMVRWLNLENAVRTSEVAAQHFMDITGENMTVTRAFVQAMHANAGPQAAYLIKQFDFPGHFVLDVGAGAGTYSVGIGQAFADASGTLLELPGTAPITAEYVQAAKLNQRFRVVSGDYRKGLPNGTFDDVLLFAVVHQEQDADALTLLRRAASALKDGGRLFLTSFFTDETHTKPQFSSMFAVEMLVMVPGGKVYTLEEIENLLQESGFHGVDRFDDIPGPATLYVATK